MDLQLTTKGKKEIVIGEVLEFIGSLILATKFEFTSQASLWFEICSGSIIWEDGMSCRSNILDGYGPAFAFLTCLPIGLTT